MVADRLPWQESTVRIGARGQRAGDVAYREPRVNAHRERMGVSAMDELMGSIPSPITLKTDRLVWR
ncbi:hypothetical protein GCM10027355_18030 [Haloplanus salinarum]